MERMTLDFGIDLGTTNSAVAVLEEVEPRLIKNNENQETTPSAVYMSLREGVVVGERAKSQLDNPDRLEDVFVEFKRRMGSQEEYYSPSLGEFRSPEALSAEVLKALKADVQQQLGEEMTGAAITIPAAFRQEQCAATRRAGELAGFRQTALLQEPVAASLAYGFRGDTEKKAFWLVFDFGGGTFDAALMKADSGDIEVVNHGGNNFLGGSDIDWALIDTVLVPMLKQTYNLPDFSRTNKQWKALFACLKRGVETAKIQLSRKEKVYLDSLSAYSHFVDADGKAIDVEGIQVMRDQIIGVTEPLVDQAVAICRKVLAEKQLDVSALDRTILVGGPTLAPYFREMLQAKLGGELDFSKDPMTVVAYGAAIFAGTQRLERALMKRAEAGQYSVALAYDPIGADEDPLVRGEVSGADGSELPPEFALTFVNEKTGWRSGKVILRGGKFQLRLQAQTGGKNVFRMELTSADGMPQDIVPGSLAYTVGATVKSQVVTADLAVALADNSKRVFIEKGATYPFRKTIRDLTVAKTVRHLAGEELRIPVMEGNHEQADCNLNLGNLVIRGEELARDLAGGSIVEVTLSAKEPGALTVKAYIPVLDQEFESVLRQDALAVPSRQQLEASFRELERRFRKNGTTDAGRLLDEIKEQLPNADNYETASQIRDKLLEARVLISEEEKNSEWPKAVKEVEQSLDLLRRIIRESNNVTMAQQRERDEVEDAVEEAIRERRITALRRAHERIMGLMHSIAAKQPEFWVALFQSLESKKYLMRNSVRADQLFSVGWQAMRRGNLQGLQQAVSELIALLPAEERPTGISDII